VREQCAQVVQRCRAALNYAEGTVDIEQPVSRIGAGAFDGAGQLSDIANNLANKNSESLTVRVVGFELR
jgi:hypothetical protein